MPTKSSLAITADRTTAAKTIQLSGTSFAPAQSHSQKADHKIRRLSIIPPFTGPGQSCRVTIHRPLLRTNGKQSPPGHVYCPQGDGNRFRLSTFLPNSDNKILSSDKYKLGRHKALSAPLRFVQGNDNVSLAHSGCFINLNSTECRIPFGNHSL